MFVTNLDVAYSFTVWRDGLGHPLVMFIKLFTPHRKYPHCAALPDGRRSRSRTNMLASGAKPSGERVVGNSAIEDVWQHGLQFLK